MVRTTAEARTTGSNMPYEVRRSSKGNNQRVVMTECPFCGADLEGKAVPNHLRNHCEAVHE